MLPDLTPAGRLKRSALNLLLAAAAVCALAAATSAPAAHADYGWFSGTGAYQNGSQCFGGQTTGYGSNTQTYASYWTNPDAGYPAIGDVYLMQLHTGAVGFTCPWGISDVSTELALPDGTRLAVDLASQDPNMKVRCFYISSSGVETEVTNSTWTAPWDASIKGKWCDSTQVPSATANGYHLGFRLLPQGAQFRVTVPVYSTKRLAGMGGAGDTTKMRGRLYSSVNSLAAPYQWVTVFDRATTIGYPAQAVTQLGDTTATTNAILNSWWRKGSVYVDLGTVASGAFTVSAGPFAIDGASWQYTVGQKWEQLIPGTDYQFRLRFVPESGGPTVGETKTFRTTGTAPTTPPPTQPQPGTGGSQPGTGTGGQQPGAGSGTGGGGAQQPSSGGQAPGAPAPAPVTAPPATPRAEPASVTQVPVFRLAPKAGLRGLVAKGLPVDVTCSAACALTATLKVDARTAKKLKLGSRPAVVATGKGRGAGAGKVRLTLRASKTAAAKLKRAKAVKATLTVKIAGGGSRSSTVTLKR